MNELNGKIGRIRTEGHLSLLELHIGEVRFKAIVIDTPETVPSLQEGADVRVLFKENEVIVGKGELGRISIQNRLLCRITALERGSLLARVVMEHLGQEVVSLITVAATRQLELKEGDEVWALIKTNEVSIAFYDEY